MKTHDYTDGKVRLAGSVDFALTGDVVREILAYAIRHGAEISSKRDAEKEIRDAMYVGGIAGVETLYEEVESQEDSDAYNDEDRAEWILDDGRYRPRVEAAAIVDRYWSTL